MKVKTYVKDGIEIVEPLGTFVGGTDTGELDEKLSALLGRGVKEVVVDLGTTVMVNASFIAILLRHNKGFRDNGGELVLANLTKEIERILRIAKLAPVFHIYESIDQAIAGLKAEKR